MTAILLTEYILKLPLLCGAAASILLRKLLLFLFPFTSKNTNATFRDVIHNFYHGVR